MSESANLKKRGTATASSGAPAESTSSATAKTDNSKKPGNGREGTSLFKTLVISLLIGLVVAFSTSFIVTDTWTFGIELPTLRKVQHVMKTQKDLVFTDQELAKYDGSDPSLPIYIAINGKVFDVSAGKDYYGPGGGYHFFSGRDAARAYITGCFQTHLTHDLRGLSEHQIASLKQWSDFYETSSKYFYVGKVIHDPIDPDSEIPKDCNVPK